jgi:hypothetical protein
MSDKAKSILKLGGALLLVSVVLFFVFRNARSLWQGGEEGARVWFYDLHAKKLYAATAATIPPDKGLGGKPGDGVRAIVVTFGGKTDDEKNRRIAYLTTYRPELKTVMDRVLASRAAGKPMQAPSPESDFYLTNTLVKRVEDANWVALNSEEAASITSEWREWRGPKGQPPAVSTP